MADERAPDVAAAAPEEAAVHLPAGLDSGDIVLFNRRCMSMAPAGAALCLLAKLSNNSRWDHVGVVVRDPRSGELLFLEADFGGVKLRSLAERVRRSRSNEIAVRRLAVVRTPAMRERLYEFANNMLGRPYEIGTGSILARVTDPVASSERDRLRALLHEKRARVAEMDRDLVTSALTATAHRVLKAERDRVAKVADRIERKLLQELGGMEGELKGVKEDLSRVFCSELVAAAYQDLGLLDRYPPAAGYIPKDFSSEQVNPPGVHLLKGSRLSSEVMLRSSSGPENPLVSLVQAFNGKSRSEKRAMGAKQEPTGDTEPGDGPPKRRRAPLASGTSGDGHARSAKRAAARGGPRVRGVSEGASPGRESRQLIREVMKRTPIYSKVPDEYKWSHLLKSFTAHVVETGDVVFEQGDFSDKIFVIESGVVDRFVSKMPDEDPVLVNTHGPRNSFGLTGFTFNEFRRSTIRARERTLLWSVDRPTFERFRDTTSDIKSILSDADALDLRGLLKEHFLFSRLDEISQADLDAFFPVKFRAGEEVFRQGERGDNFYVIKSGELERHIRHPRPGHGYNGGSGGGMNGSSGSLGSNGTSSTGSNGSGNSKGTGSRDDDSWYAEEDSSSLAKTLRPGQSFGELSLMYNAPRAATVRARTDSECWAISAENFARLNLGKGTKYLRAIFERFASVKKDGESYMTASDLLNFADVSAFEDEACRQRVSSLLVRLVTSNRERDPTRNLDEKIRAVNRRHRGNLRGTIDIYYDVDDVESETSGVLMDFWEFVRFDLVLNQPCAKLDFAFRLADENNSGFISLSEMQYLLQDYAEIDPVAADMLSGKNKILEKVFGRDGSRTLSAKEFQALSDDILPPLFLDDLQNLTHHMLTMDPSMFVAQANHEDIDELSFIEPDSPFILGSQFVGPSPSHGSKSDGASQGAISAGMTSLSSWLASGGDDDADDAADDTADDARAEKRASSIPWAHLISVGVSGTMSRTVVAPLERLKILMQTETQPLRYRGIVSGMRAMVRQDTSVWRACFRGNGTNVMRIVPNVGIQLAVVDALQRSLVARERASAGAGASLRSADKDATARGRESPLTMLAIGGIAGMTSAAATYPLEFVRGRLSVQHATFAPYRGTLDGLRRSVARDGAASVYRGLTPTLLGMFPYMGLSFAAYEVVQPVLPRRNDDSGLPTDGSAILFGALCNVFGQVAAYPLDTVRRRMQVAGFAGAAQRPLSLRAAFAGVLREGGPRALFRGLAPNLLKVAPAGGVSFLCYERMRELRL